MKKNVFAVLVLFFSFAFAQNSTLTQAVKQLDALLFWDTLSQTGIITKNGKQLQFKSEEPLVLLNNNRFDTVDSPQNINGIIHVSQSFISYTQNFFSLPPQNEEEPFFRIGAILIDPGHGGKDPGTIAAHTVNGKKINITEKDIALTVSKDLHSQLIKAYPNKKILLTRTNDTYLTLEQRVETAHNVALADNEAILYISIHANSAFDKKASGYEVWYLSPGHRRTVISQNTADKELIPILNSMLEEEYTTESILIAKYILDGIKAQIGTKTVNRGIKPEEWYVVRNAHMPSVLVEIGFLSNAQEAVLLSDSTYLHNIALGIYNGLASFISIFERSKGFTAAQ